MTGNRRGSTRPCRRRHKLRSPEAAAAVPVIGLLRDQVLALQLRRQRPAWMSLAPVVGKALQRTGQDHRLAVAAAEVRDDDNCAHFFFLLIFRLLAFLAYQVFQAQWRENEKKESVGGGVCC